MIKDTQKCVSHRIERGVFMSDWKPSISISTAKGTREVSLMTEHLGARRVFLTGDINTEMAEKIISQLIYLDGEEKPIHLIINSSGGSISDGMMIYDILQGLRSPVEMYCVGRASSMAAWLLASGEKGHRHILPHAITMIHEPLMAGGVGGSATSINRISESIMGTKKMLNHILAIHTGRKEREIDKATSYDNYMNAEESIEFGLCDDIVTHIG